MWSIPPPESAYLRAYRHFEKKHPRELAAMLDNFDTYHGALNEGAHPLHKRHGFMHLEPAGVVAIDQKGGGNGLRETRLYVYPESARRLLHLITMGFKNQQRDDIATCRAYVASLRKLRADDHEDLP